MRLKRTRTRKVALTPAILLWRTAHGLITVAFLAAIVVIWRSALTGDRSRWLRAVVAAVVGEGAAVALNTATARWDR